MKTRLSKLNFDHLKISPAWISVGDYANDVDKSLSALKDPSKPVPSIVEEVWVLCEATFADGSKHPGIAMCRGDSNLGPLLWTIWNGSENISLYLPPAPKHVIDVRGPRYFCQKFTKQEDDVFPIRIEVVPEFEIPPKKRKISLRVDGPVVLQ